jgi:hypothetical protein
LNVINPETPAVVTGYAHLYTDAGRRQAAAAETRRIRETLYDMLKNVKESLRDQFAMDDVNTSKGIMMQKAILKANSDSELAKKVDNYMENPSGSDEARAEIIEDVLRVYTKEWEETPFKITDPESIVYNKINAFFKDTKKTDSDKISQLKLNQSYITSIKNNFSTKDLFNKNWIGKGGGQEEMANDVWVRMINTINSYKNESDSQYTMHDTIEDIEDIKRIIKLFLINLDKPVPEYSYCSESSITDQTTCEDNNTWISGPSPLDIFLYKDSQGINVAQLEALL